MMQGLDATADLVFMVGYHGSISGESSVLSHTYNPAVASWVRGVGAVRRADGEHQRRGSAGGVPVVRGGDLYHPGVQGTLTSGIRPRRR